MSDDSEVSNLYYMPLKERADGVLSPLDPDRIRSSDLALLEDLSDFILARYSKRKGIVEAAGRLYETEVFYPIDGNDHFYVIVDAEGAPVNATTADSELPGAELALLEDTTHQVEYSEALSPRESISIYDSFIDPEFEEIDRNGNAQKHVGWGTLLDTPRAVIIGAPGAGKTTTLRRLALEYLERWKNDRSATFPVYVQMRHFREGEGVERIVRSNVLEHNHIDASDRDNPVLATMRIILILDGLDEVAEAEREHVANSLADFSSVNQVVSILVSTRESGYRWDLPSFRYFRLLPFNLARIREWSFYRLGSGVEAPWRDFMASLEERPELLELAGNPLLLSLAVSLYRRSSALPQNRSTLLKSYFDAVTEQWDSIRGVVRQREPWAGPVHKLAALCRTAYKLRSYGRGSFTTTDFKIWNRDFDVDGSLLYVCARHTGVLTKEPSQEVWSFTHRTFCDFLSARYIVDHTTDAAPFFEPFFKTGDWVDIWAYSCGISQDATNLVLIVLRNRHIHKREKLQALASAFEQDIIVSSSTGRATVAFFKAEIGRLLLKDRTVKVTSHGSQRQPSRIDFKISSGNELYALFDALQKLRKSRVGTEIFGWLAGSNVKILTQLANVFNTRDVVSVMNSATLPSHAVHVSLSDELAKIAEDNNAEALR